MNRKINCRSLGCAALAASMVCLSACDDKLPVDGAKGNVTILARIDDGVATRTCVGNSSDDGVVGIMWSPGDRIGVYGTAGTKNAMFASTNTGAVAEAAFSGDLKAGEEPQYAYYPYSADNAAADADGAAGLAHLLRRGGGDERAAVPVLPEPWLRRAVLYRDPYEGV